MEIKKISVDHATQLLRFYHKILDENLITIRIKSKPTLEEEIRYIQNINCSGFILGMFDSLDIIGIVTLKGSKNKFFSLGIAIDEEYRNIGIGNKLIKNAIDMSLEYTINKIELEVLSINTVAINLYKKCGFEIVRVEENYLYIKKYYDMVFMERRTG